jgi:hypothetical protein
MAPHTLLARVSSVWRPHPPRETTRPTKPAWQELIDPQERPNREDGPADYRFG